MIVALAGGVGAAKFLSGLVAHIPQHQLTVIVNTGDDAEFHGLHVSPDLDTVTYTLAGLVDPEQGWGVADDTFACLSRLGELGAETWFRLGDRDLATHIRRTELLRQGVPLSATASAFARAVGVTARIIPMSDQPVRTVVGTPEGPLAFQEYFVRRGAEDQVTAVSFKGVELAGPAPGVIEAIAEAKGIVICPSNPVISIGPILAVPTIREALRRARGTRVAISPIVGGKALKGPSDRMLRALGHEATARAVAAMYRDLVDTFVIDEQDSEEAGRITALDMRVVVTNTIMGDMVTKQALAAKVMEAIAKGAELGPNLRAT